MRTEVSRGWRAGRGVETINGKGGPVLAATYSPAGLRVRGDQIFPDLRSQVSPLPHAVT